jgi:hypothetical protein
MVLDRCLGDDRHSALMLAFPNAAYASLEAGAIPHRVIESGTAEADPRNDREERTFPSPAVAAAKNHLRHIQE